MGQRWTPRGGAHVVAHPSISAHFHELGNVVPGQAFAFTPKQFMEEFAGEWERVPRPDYEHRIYRDPVTDNYMVIRPDAKGNYYPPPAAQIVR